MASQYPSASLKGRPSKSGTSQKGYTKGRTSGKLGKVGLSTKKGFNQKRMSKAVKKVFGMTYREDKGQI